MILEFIAKFHVFSAVFLSLFVLDCFYPDLRVTYVPLCAEQNEAGCYGNRPTPWHAYLHITTTFDFVYVLTKQEAKMR